MEKEVILLVLAALMSIVSSLITITFNYRLSRRLSQEQEQHEAQKELRKSLTYGLDDVRRAGLGPLRGKDNVNSEAGILPNEIAELEVDTKKLIKALNSADVSFVKLKHLLQLALEIDKTNSH